MRKSLGVYSNNNTLVTLREFVQNPILLIKGTIDRKASLIIFDNKLEYELLAMSHTMLEKYHGGD